MKRRRGFTLVELLVVIAIIGVLVALLLPAVQKVRAAAQRAHCSNNLKQIALGAHGYHDAFSSLPPGSTLSPSQASTLALLLPHLEQDNLYRQFDFSTSAAYGPVNSGPRAQQVHRDAPVGSTISVRLGSGALRAAVTETRGPDAVSWKTDSE